MELRHLRSSDKNSGLAQKAVTPASRASSSMDQPVDEVDAVVVPAAHRLAGTQHRLPAGEGPLRPQPHLLEHIGHAVTGVEIVVHHQGTAVFQPGNQQALPGPAARPEGEVDSKL